MKGKNSFQRCLKHVGRNTSLVNGCGKTIQTERCLLQALRYKNKMYLEGTPTDIGINEAGYYLLIAPPAFAIGEIGQKGYLTDGSKRYTVDTWEKIYFGSDVLYIWAVLKEYSAGSDTSYNHFA